MKTITLVGQFAGLRVKVDSQDYETVSKIRWWGQAAPGMATVYAIGLVGGRPVRMHRMLLGLSGRSTSADHRDGDGLNNQRSNLRICRHDENMKNRRRHRHSQWRFKGVFFDQSPNCARPWRARIHSGRHRTNLGRFASEEEAAMAYDRAARRLHGEFAKTNF